ncbi:MAG: heme lyase CcmF/NrfE family subunit [Proteobacteria bacterium]|nr:heme lyase CcmF/NrfE family subunit [Pseudomonadota bacterium]
MIPELGHFCLILALLCAGVQSFVPQLSARAAKAQFVFCAAALLLLVVCYLVSDLSVVNVVKNSHTLKPFLYKISGAWGNHEGSMLLWVALLSLYGFLMSGRAPVTAVRTQGLTGFGFLSFILLTSNPFGRIHPPPVDGNDLNPLLQDPGLAFHPPLLYMGYVGFSVAFSFAIAALREGKMDQAWARAVKPWVLFAWTALTAGIGLGSWWAYYELGWGGWWFWDPVENASLMPWLLGTALLHSVMVVKKREALKRWTALLAILTFSLSMLGTFLVRSGVLTSVHAFALDPARGIFILGLLGFFTGGALLLYALRAHLLSSDATFAPVSRESSLILNNLFLAVIAATVFTGTMYPLVLQALNAGAISVGPPYFHRTVLPVAVPLIALMAAGPFLPWKKAEMRGVAQKLKLSFAVSVCAALAVFAAATPHPGFSALGIGLAVWLVTGTLAKWAAHAGLPEQSLKNAWPRIRHMKASHWCLALTHAGLGIAIAGMIGTGPWTQEKLEVLEKGQTMDIAGYALTLEDVAPAFGPNYRALRGQVKVTPPGGNDFTLHPEGRYYPVAEKTTVEAAIRTSWRNDIYIVIGEQDSATEGFAVHAWIHPLVPLLWLGYTVMVLGGLIGLAGRKNEKTG